jgi:hypothetical protein
MFFSRFWVVFFTRWGKGIYVNARKRYIYLANDCNQRGTKEPKQKAPVVVINGILLV